MNSLRTTLLAAAGAAMVIGGGAYAASQYDHHMQVRLPDGEIAQVQYTGDIAPRVVVEPVPAQFVARSGARPVAVVQDPLMAIGFPGFGSMDRVFADMAREQAAMMQQVAMMQHEMVTQGAMQAGATPGGAPGVLVSGHPGNGLVHWTYVSSTTSSNGCTQTMEWHSGGASANGATQPQVIRTSAGNCQKAVQNTPVHEVSDVKPQAAVPVAKTV